MNSHILIPKAVYKRFVNDMEFYYKYDVKTKSVVKGYPRTTFTEKDYYSEDMEKILNKYIETPLKTLLSFADKNTLENTEIVLDEKLEDVAKTYIISLTARSPKMFDMVYENSVFIQLLAKQNQHDTVVALTMDNKEYYKFFDRFDITFLINKTDIPLVLPTRGIYEYTINNVQCCNIPLTPKFSILLKENGKQIHFEEGKTFFTVQDKVIIEKMNSYAFTKQVNDGVGCVVSSNKNILEILRDETV